MTKEQKQMLAGAIAFIVLIIFAFMHAPLIVDAWNNTGLTPHPPPGPTELMTILSAGVGGFLATLFGVPAPAFGAKVFGGPAVSWKTILAWAYVIVYFGVTAAAVLLWWTKAGVTPDVLKTQAQLGLGLGVAIIASLAKEM